MIHTRVLLLACLVPGLVLAWAVPAVAQPTIDDGAVVFNAEPGGQIYEDDFDDLPSDAGPNPFIQGDQAFPTKPGWYADAEVGQAMIRGGDGSVPGMQDGISGAIWSFGDMPDDRALGACGGNVDGEAEEGAVPGAFAFGVLLRNESNFEINRIRVEFFFEIWRETGIPQTTKFYYRIGDPNDRGFDLADPNPEGASWIAVADLDLDAPASFDFQDRLVDGNNEDNREQLEHTISNLAVPVGAEIWLGWRDPNDDDPDAPPGGGPHDWGNRDQGLSIDELEIEVSTDSPIIAVSNGTEQINTNDVFTVNQGAALTDVFDLDIDVSDPQGDMVELTTTISNFTDQGFLIATEWESGGSIATPFSFSPVTGTFTQVTTHDIVLTADDGARITVFRFTIQVVPPLDVGDVMIVGARSDTPVAFAFVTWVALPGGFQLRFTNDAYDTTTGNFIGEGDTITWTAPFFGIAEGEVIRIFDDGNEAFADDGEVEGSISSISNDGDQIFVFQGEKTNPLNRRMIFGLNWANPGWLTSGTADANRSYLPPELNTTDGNLDIGSARGTQDNAQFAGPRGAEKSFDTYRIRVLNTAAWALTNAGGSFQLAGTDFELNTTIGSGGVSSTSSCGANPEGPARLLPVLLATFVLGLAAIRRRA